MSARLDRIRSAPPVHPLRAIGTGVIAVAIAIGWLVGVIVRGIAIVLGWSAAALREGFDIGRGRHRPS